MRPALLGTVQLTVAARVGPATEREGRSPVAEGARDTQSIIPHAPPATQAPRSTGAAVPAVPDVRVDRPCVPAVEARGACVRPCPPCVRPCPWTVRSTFLPSGPPDGARCPPPRTRLFRPASPRRRYRPP